MGGKVRATSGRQGGNVRVTRAQAWAVTNGEAVRNGEGVRIGKRPPVYGGGALILLFLYTRARNLFSTVSTSDTIACVTIEVMGLLTFPTNAVLTEMLSSFHTIAVVHIPATWGCTGAAHAFLNATRITLEYQIYTHVNTPISPVNGCTPDRHNTPNSTNAPHTYG